MNVVELQNLETGALASTALTSAAAGAASREGVAAPDATVEDADGHVSDLGVAKGKAVLIVYEDRGSASQNQVLKDELSQVALARENPPRVVLAAVADVSAWDFEPAKHFVRAAIRQESRRQGTTIYCDWTGAFRAAFRLRRGVSNVVLVGRDGRVTFAAEGTLGPEQRARLLSLIRAELDIG